MKPFSLLPLHFATRLPAAGLLPALLLVLLLGPLVLAGGAGPAGAQGPTTYEITVPVDVKAADAVTARRQALQNGPVLAATDLFRRMAMRDDFRLLPKVTPESIAPLVRAVDISSERTSSVRYIADLKVIFDAPGIRALLTQAGVRFAQTVSRPVLVLPVLRTGRAVTLWDQENPWLAGWVNQSRRGGLVPLQVPLGDIADVNDVGGTDAILRDEARLLRIAQRYGVKDIMIARATVDLDDRNRPRAVVDIDRLGTLKQNDVVNATYPGSAGQDLVSLLDDVAAKSARAIEENWKRQNLIRADENQNLFCMVPLKRPADWSTVRSRLRGVQLVRRFQQMSLTTTQVRLWIAYVGTVEQLRTGMAQQDLRIGVDGDGCVLQPREAPPMAPPALSSYMPRLAAPQAAPQAAPARPTGGFGAYPPPQ